MHQAYEIHNDQYGVRISYILSDADRKHNDSICVISYDAYKWRACRKKDFRLREGKGAGNEALVYFEALPHEWKQLMLKKFGDPRKAAHPMEKFYTPDGEARRFYTHYRFNDGEYLKPEQIERYTINASVLNAIQLLVPHRSAERKMRGISTKKLWESVVDDVKSFNTVLAQKHNTRHTLPESGDRLRDRLKLYNQLGYSALVDGRNKNSNSVVVTPLMVDVWKQIYAGQRGQKPNHLEVYRYYMAFLEGTLEIINNNTGEAYDPTHIDFKSCSDKTVYSYQNQWQNKIATHARRTGNAQQYKGQFIPYHKTKAPEFAGSLISVDDRQPKLEYAPGKRIWSYIAADVASQAITCWVYGDTKEGLIYEFYRQMARNYGQWELPLPYELEGEMSLNSGLRETLLKNGAMFQRVRLEANNARGKIIERIFRDIAHKYEKLIPGFKARPFARDEANQPGPEKPHYYTKEEIIQLNKRVIWEWNNELHPNQKLYEGMTRWDVFMDKQHPALLAHYPTHWAGFLPYLGKAQKTSLNVGRIKLQYKDRMLGINGQVALGDDLINIMRQIEGEEVMVHWLDNDKGQVMKALVYTLSGQYVCELMGDMEYNRASLERTGDDEEIRKINSAYTNTVNSYMRRAVKEIDTVTLIQAPKPQGRFVMPGLDYYTPTDGDAEVLPPMDEESYLIPVETPVKSLLDRF